jgi:ribosome-associated translation inhibitor RaiA
MRIQVRARAMKLSKAQRARLAARLTFALARFGESIDRVIVRLSDVAEPAGFKRCQLDVSARTGLVTVEHSDADVFLALEHAARRAARSVGRSIEKASWPVGG